MQEPGAGNAGDKQWNKNLIMFITAMIWVQRKIWNLLTDKDGVSKAKGDDGGFFKERSERH